MTPEEHAAWIADEAHRLIVAKYMKGQSAHGGELWRKTGLIDMAIDEAVDQVVYLLTLRDQLQDAGLVLGEIADPHHPDA